MRQFSQTLLQTMQSFHFKIIQKPLGENTRFIENFNLQSSSIWNNRAQLAAF